MDLDYFLGGRSLIWPASMLFFGARPPRPSESPTLFAPVTGVACFGGDRREQPTINAPRPSPYARLAPHEATAFKPPRPGVCCVQPRRRPGQTAPAAPAPSALATAPPRVPLCRSRSAKSGPEPAARPKPPSRAAGAGRPMAARVPAAKGHPVRVPAVAMAAGAGPGRQGSPGGGAAQRGLRVPGSAASVYKCNLQM